LRWQRDQLKDEIARLRAEPPTDGGDLISRKAAIEALDKAWRTARNSGRLWQLNELHYAKELRDELLRATAPEPPTLKCHHIYQCGHCFEQDNIECRICGENQ
jgi:hypothetical protein